MDRDFSPERSENRRELAQGRPEARQRTNAQSPLRAHEDPEREVALDRQRYDGLTDIRRAALFEIGRFRTVAVQDLANHLYGGEASRLRQDQQALMALGLVQRRTALVASGRAKLTVLVLTKLGKRLLESDGKLHGQAVYAGFVKPAEVAHDAAIYRMFHKEAGKIVSQGGTLRRVVLDYELKRNVYAPLAKARHLPEAEYAQKQAQVAQENGLKVINGKIPLPDLRIEYETAGGERTFVDLELATHHYHGSHLQLKAQAGFKLYAADDLAVRTPVHDEREITAEILSL